jgi:hypothetical protein
MGLQGYYSTPEQAYGAAYANINHINIHREEAFVFVNMYSNKASRDAIELPIYQNQFIYNRADLYNGNIMELAYAKVKLEPLFQGWIDVIEEDPPLAQVIQFSALDDPPPSDPNVGA